MIAEVHTRWKIALFSGQAMVFSRVGARNKVIGPGNEAIGPGNEAVNEAIGLGMRL